MVRPLKINRKTGTKPASTRGFCALSGRALAACLVGPLVFHSRIAFAQQALRNFVTAQELPKAGIQQMENEAYTIKQGDFKLLVSPSLGMDWNSNVGTSTGAAQQDDFIIKPLVNFAASYPLSEINALNLSIGAGYDKYLKHDRLSTWRLESGTQLSLDLAVKDFIINAHDRVSYSQDSSQEAAVANTSQFGNIQNTAGLQVSRDFHKFNLSAGYDHQTVISGSGSFNSQNHSSELFVTQAGIVLSPALTVGIEPTATLTTYDGNSLNNNENYSAGVYATWHPGNYFQISPRAGYTITKFQQTSLTNRTSDLGSYYFDITASHQINDVITYALSFGQETRQGIQSDAIQDWYVRPSATLRIIKNLDLHISLSYEHGNQGAGNISGNLTETYDHYSGDLGFNYQLMKKLGAGFDYRLTTRSSTAASARGYTQNEVSIRLTYTLQ